MRDGRVRFILIGLLLALDGASALSQTKQASVEIGGHEIALGMPADQVVGALRENWRVEAGGKPPIHEWLVSDGNEHKLPFGLVYAKGNVVVGVEYLLFTRELISAQDVFDALFEASLKISQERRNNCVVTTWTGYTSPGLDKSAINFTCGAYRIRLQRNQFQGAASYMVWEELGTTD